MPRWSKAQLWRVAVYVLLPIAVGAAALHVLSTLHSQAHDRALAIDNAREEEHLATVAMILSNYSPCDAPRVGGVEFGAYAPEAAHRAGIRYTNIPSLNGKMAYRHYRRAVRDEFGANLADMNYLGVGLSDWRNSYRIFETWLLRAGRYGEPTIAIEPMGREGYGVFRDSDEMRALRQAFETARGAGVVVWVRFASEANLTSSAYSVFKAPDGISEFRRSFAWFKQYMPSNVRMVFSPLINTVYTGSRRQRDAIAVMFPPECDRIGGTLYATTGVDCRVAWRWYHDFMRRLAPTTPFQICELGGTHGKKDEVTAFVDEIVAGVYPDLQRVNLFAGELNSRATRQHGAFGLLLPGEEHSYLWPILVQAAPEVTTPTPFARSRSPQPKGG